MDFDEYEYLEKTVENTEPEKSKETVNGSDKAVKPDDRDRRRSSKHKSDDSGNGSHHSSKRAKSVDESRDIERGDRDRERERGDRHREKGDRDRERDSSRHRSSPRDGGRSDRDRYRSSREHRDREKDREREERNQKDRDRGMESKKDHEQERRVRDRGSDKERDRESEREQSYLSRSRTERQRDEPEREKSRDREFGEKGKEKESRELDRGNRRYKEKREEAAEPEVDPERDQRTVFAYQICLKADERDVYEFFSRAGKVRDVHLIMDRKSRRSRGVGYIEFYDAMSVPMAIALSGQTLLGQPVMVKPSEAEKNLVQSTASSARGGLVGPHSGGARKLYVGNLHYNIREDQLRQVFEAFGTVELVQLPLDQETGQSKGYGFVQFARLEDAKAAQSLNGQLEIAGRAIKVSLITDQAGMQDIGANPGDFDDDEGGGLSLNARSRAILMQKLDRTGTASSITGTFGSPGLPLPTAPILGGAPIGSPLVQAPVSALDIIGVPSECLLLKNMFDPHSELEPDFDEDIKEDVQGECSKYGMLKHIFVDKNTAGFVYLRFDNTQAAAGAQRALHGRWFAGKMITATFMLPQDYESKFPDSM